MAKAYISGYVDIDVLRVSGGPIIPPEGGGGEPPLGIWGGGNVPMPTPPIYIPVGDPPAAWVPVFPTNPIVIPTPPTEGPPKPPVVWPPLPGGVPPVGGYPGYPAPPLGIWGGGNQPFPTPPIYIPSPPPGSGEPPQIWVPVFPTPPIYLPPGSEQPPDPVLPELPPDMVNPPSGARGFWGYSPGYKSMVFVPYEGAGTPGQPPVAPGR